MRVFARDYVCHVNVSVTDELKHAAMDRFAQYNTVAVPFPVLHVPLIVISCISPYLSYT